MRQIIKQVVYTIFITNIYTPFHLWQRKKFFKYQRVPKYYESRLQVSEIAIMDHFFLIKNISFSLDFSCQKMK